MKKLLYITATTGVLFTLSCGGGSEETPPPDPIPLAVGNWWLMQDITDTTQWYKDSIVAREAFGSHPEAYKVIETGSDKGFGQLLRFPYSDTMWVFYDGDYFMVAMTAEYPMDTMELIWFKKDPAVGDNWSTRLIRIEDFEPDGTPDTIIVRFNGSIVGQADVTVPAGTFNDTYKAFYTVMDSLWLSSYGSWQVEQDTMGWTYWALGTGGVKTTDYPDESTGSQLKDYHVE
ncbi:MAG: hypothetical protein ACP5QG_07375 [candidate division WOR-3 bacterium]